jgi:hypothetical protein
MTKNIHYYAIAELPKLGWVAAVALDGGSLTVFHGSAVECRDDWMVEGVWDDDFKSGNFHCSENFFGSGIRIEGDRIYFVASSALVDRLFYCSYGGKILVSNSLILLMVFTGSTLDDNHNYKMESAAVLKGIRDYNKEFVIIHPRMQKLYQVYHSNIILQNSEISYEIRGVLHEIGSFAQYYELLSQSLARIKNNYESPERKTPLSAFTTLSSGYDSTAVTCLAKNIGVKTCFTGNKASSSIPIWLSRSAVLEDTQPIADALKLNTVHLDHRWSSISEDELYFLAASHIPPELIFHSLAAHIEKTCKAAVVFTGYHGDKVWDAHTSGKYLNDQIVRGDISGLNLSEIRLKSGFINVAVPFILARNIESIVKITLSTEMSPWRLNNSYDRPIPRRIAESAGVNRHLFGTRKKAVIKDYYYPANAQLRRQFFESLRKDYNISPRFVYSYIILNRLGYFSMRALKYSKHFIRSKTLSISPDTYKILKTTKTAFWNHIDFHYLMYIWSIRILCERTARNLYKHINTFTDIMNLSVLSEKGCQSSPVLSNLNFNHFSAHNRRFQ